jgi:hypothetical protein
MMFFGVALRLRKCEWQRGMGPVLKTYPRYGRYTGEKLDTERAAANLCAASCLILGRMESDKADKAGWSSRV